MAKIHKTPPGLGTGGALDCLKLAGCDGSEINQTIPEIHKIRAAWLARRVPLSPQSARAVLSLYFEERSQ